METSTNETTGSSTDETAPPRTNPQTPTVPQTATLLSESRSTTTTRSDTSRLQLLADIAEKELSKPKPKPRKTKVIAKYCCFHDCKNNSSMDGINFTRIQPTQKDLPGDASTRKIITNVKKKTLRELELVRCGLAKNDMRKDLRICSQHDNEKVTISKVIKIGNESIKKKFELTIPSCQGVASLSAPAEKENKGLGVDRLKRNMVDLYCEKNKRAKKKKLC